MLLGMRPNGPTYRQAQGKDKDTKQLLRKTMIKRGYSLVVA